MASQHTIGLTYLVPSKGASKGGGIYRLMEGSPPS